MKPGMHEGGMAKNFRWISSRAAASYHGHENYSQIAKLLTGKKKGLRLGSKLASTARQGRGLALGQGSIHVKRASIGIDCSISGVSQAAMGFFLAFAETTGKDQSATAAEHAGETGPLLDFYLLMAVAPVPSSEGTCLPLLLPGPWS